jgi:hypothetical protein
MNFRVSENDPVARMVVPSSLLNAKLALARGGLLEKRARSLHRLAHVKAGHRCSEDL